jgi:benzoate-CoA ligase
MVEFPENFNLADYHLDKHIREGNGQRIAIRCHDDSYTYEDIFTKVNQLGNALNLLGVKREQRVGIIMPDLPEFIISWLAIVKIGAVVNTLNPLYPAEDYPPYFEHLRPTVLILHDSVVDKLAGIIPQFKSIIQVIVVGEKKNRYLDFDDVIKDASHELEPAKTHRDDPAVMLYSGGTTGFPKIFIHTHATMGACSECYGKKVYGIRPDDIVLAVPKLIFTYALGDNFLFPFSVSATCILFPERSTPDTIFDLLEKHRPTILINVPTMINAMLTHPRASEADLSCLRFCTTAGEALPVTIYDRWQDMFDVPLMDGIGMTELFHIFISNTPDDIKVGSLGHLVPGYDAKIVDPEGEELPVGKVGAIWVKGPSSALAVWHNHQASKKIFNGEWTISADQFRRDEEGRFWYYGRQDDLLKVAGQWVAPLEIELCLYRHPAVLEVCVVGASDKDGLIKPKAVVALNDGYTASDETTKDLQNFVKEHLVLNKYPRIVDYVDALPRTERGKVNRTAVNAEHGG